MNQKQFEEEKKANTKKFLHYGAIITIRDHNDHTRFFQGDGFASDNLSISEMSSSYQHMFTRSLFMVLPTFSSAVKHKCRDISKKLRGLNPTKMEQTVREQEYNVLNEYMNNFEYCRKMTEVPVKYSTPIQLLHINSKKFLSVPLGFKPGIDPTPMTLSELPSDRSIFKFLNVFRYQSQGDRNIFYHTPLKLSYHLGLDEIYPTVNMKPSESISGNLFEPVLDMNIYTRLEINLYSDVFGVDEKYMRGGDIIWIRQLDYSKMLATKSEISKKQSNFGKIDKMENTKKKTEKKLKSDEMEFFCEDVELISIAKSNSEDCLVTRGMWIIENLMKTNGDPIKWKKPFRLLSLATQKYLALEINPKNFQVKICFESDSSCVSTKFSFVALSGNERGNVLRNDYVILKHFVTGYNINVTLSKGNAVINLSRRISGENTLKVSRCQESERIVTYLEMSSYNFLNGFFEALEEFQAKRDFTNAAFLIPYVVQAFNLIKMLREFLRNQTLFSKFNQKFGKLNKSRQRFLFDQDYIKLIAHILNILYSSSEVNMIKKGEMQSKKVIQEKKNFMRLKSTVRSKRFGSMIDLKEEEKIFFSMASKIKKNVRNKSKEQVRKEMHYLLICKMMLSDEIYNLMSDVCKGVDRHQIEAFHHLNLYIEQFAYLDSCRNFISSLIKNNQKIAIELKKNFNFQRIENMLIDENKYQIDLVVSDPHNDLTKNFEKIQVELFRSKRHNIKVNFISNFFREGD